MIDDLVSIIMPAFNSSTTIRRALDSVINQTYEKWEVIIVDDCSTDNTVEIVKEIIKEEKKIKLIISDTNRGTAVSRNMAVKVATGRYISFLDSDDFLDPSYLEEQVRFISENGPIVTSSYRMKSAKNSIIFHVPKTIKYTDLLKQNTLSCLTTMYDKSIIGDHLFPEKLVKAEDYVFWLNILKLGFVAKGNDLVLATYIIHSKSKSYNKLKLIKPMYFIYRKTQKLSFIKSCYYVFLWGINGLIKYRKVR